jgi:hypothetical protein
MNVSGTSDLLTTVAAMQAGGVQQSIATAATRQAIQSERAVADMVAQTAASAAPGMGQLVDRKV